MESKSVIQIVTFTFVLTILVLAGMFFMPWKYVQWGKITVSQPSTITVSGYAKGQIKSQIAVYSAGINVVNDSKEKAIDEVNQKISGVIEAIKEFGIEAADIKTQNLNVYQGEETYYEDGRQKSRPGQWRVSNTIEIKLREVNRASELADILTQTGANNIYGPNFSLDDTKGAENELFGQAVTNAQEKAGIAAKASGRTLGKILNINENMVGSAIPYARMEGGGGGGGAAIEPGTGTVEKNITVTFELK